MAKSTFQQAMLIGIGLMVAIGFSGVFTYGNLINSQGGNNEGNQEINATLPTENYIQGSYDLSVEEQAYLSANNQVVFVNALYKNTSENYTKLEEMPSQFDNQVYVNRINISESTFASQLRVETPSALIIGDQPVRTQRGTRPYTISSSRITQEEVTSSICSSKRDVSSFGATCFS